MGSLGLELFVAKNGLVLLMVLSAFSRSILETAMPSSGGNGLTPGCGECRASTVPAQLHSQASKHI